MSAVIYLAAITGFDSGIYEAAEIDGAGRPQQNRDKHP
jgi:ABC-type polysaccharide transport system permease subunit